MQIVGITGSIGSGKTTFAQLLSGNAESSQHFESWLVIAEIANEFRELSPKHPDSTDVDGINEWLNVLPPIVTRVCRKPVSAENVQITKAKLRDSPDSYTKLHEYLELMAAQPQLQRVSITEVNKETFRSLLQWLGGYFVKTISTGIWYDEIIRRINTLQGVDVATVGGVRFPGEARRITRAGGTVIRIERPGISARDASEVTERERSLIVSDTTIINDAGLPELRSTAAHVWKDLSNEQLVTEYIASNVQA